ncbi:MAG: signal peptidase II [Gemmatimonadetes bacterium]|nr:signal peptidase II [Gemmatimonadota bacterium]
MDIVTKYVAHVTLRLEHIPHQVVGNIVRWTLLYNPGAAFGLSLGPQSRWLLLGITGLMLGILWRLYRATPADRWIRAIALGLVAGGALGNLLTRIWSPRGVVDFIDVGIGTSRWPAFNVADIGVTTGALLLALVFQREEASAHTDGNATLA